MATSETKTVVVLLLCSFGTSHDINCRHMLFHSSAQSTLPRLVLNSSFPSRSWQSITHSHCSSGTLVNCSRFICMCKWQ